MQRYYDISNKICTVGTRTTKILPQYFYKTIQQFRRSCSVLRLAIFFHVLLLPDISDVFTVRLAKQG